VPFGRYFVVESVYRTWGKVIGIWRLVSPFEGRREVGAPEDGQVKNEEYAIASSGF
jgi:hypothetical protein